VNGLKHEAAVHLQSCRAKCRKIEFSRPSSTLTDIITQPIGAGHPRAAHRKFMTHSRTPGSAEGSSELKKAGLKATVPRLKILEMLEASAHPHLTAEEVYQRLHDSGEDVGLATVYRVLTQFEQAGLVIRHNFEGERAVFELNKGSHHDHMVCMKCGKVFEFQDTAIEERQRRVAEKAGFVIEDHSLYLYGMCEGMKKNGVCSKK
jgi:Fur family ferric uptake transcriptional regulator